jgi:hypothetical protein
MRPPPPILLKSQNTEGSAVGQVGAENQKGRMARKISPYLKSCSTETLINIGQCRTSKNKKQQCQEAVL